MLTLRKSPGLKWKQNSSGKKNAGGEYGEGLDDENVKLCEKVNEMRAELARAEKERGELDLSTDDDM